MRHWPVFFRTRAKEALVGTSLVRRPPVRLWFVAWSGSLGSSAVRALGRLLLLGYVGYSCQSFELYLLIVEEGCDTWRGLEILFRGWRMLSGERERLPQSRDSSRDLLCYSPPAFRDVVSRILCAFSCRWSLRGSALVLLHRSVPQVILLIWFCPPLSSECLVVSWSCIVFGEA